MTRRAVLVWPDLRLRARALPVTGFDDALTGLAAEMLVIMYAAPGRGLAATQLGVMQRLFVMDCTWKEGMADPRVLVNPVVVSRSADCVGFAEGCLSLPGIVAEVGRPGWVGLRWQGLDGAGHEGVFDGFAAVCVQHELDHLDGILCIDHLAAGARAALDPALAALELRA